MQNFQYVGLGIVLLILLVIPQLQYSKNKEHYFTIAEDYETCLLYTSLWIAQAMVQRF